MDNFQPEEENKNEINKNNMEQKLNPNIVVTYIFNHYIW